jgi:hypothetical protein
MLDWVSSSRFYPLYLVGLVCMTIAVDFLTGPELHFPILYLLPIGLVTWFGWQRWGYGLALTMPLMRFCFGVIQPEFWSGAELLLNALVRMTVFLLFVYLINRTAKQHRALQHEVRVLTGLLPICSVCKKIRNQTNEWIQLEQYISDHSGAQFSHGLCPDCVQQHYSTYVRSAPSP